MHYTTMKSKMVTGLFLEMGWTSSLLFLVGSFVTDGRVEITFICDHVASSAWPNVYGIT